MSSCAICHAGFSRIMNRPRNCKRCQRIVCQDCSTYVAIDSIPLTVQNIPRDGRKKVRLCRSCIADLTKPFNKPAPGGEAVAERGIEKSDISLESIAASLTETASSTPGIEDTATATAVGVEQERAHVVATEVSPDYVKPRPMHLSPALHIPWWMLLAMPFAHSAMKWQTHAEKTIGHVYIRVIEADGLLAFGRTGLRGARHTSNPFAEVAVGQHVVTMRTTRAISYTVSPVWDEAFMFAVQSPYALIRVTIWHHITAQRKEPLGEILLPIHLFADQKAHDLWCFLRPCGAPPGEKGIKQIVSLADSTAGTNIGDAIEGVRAKTAIVPPSAVASIRDPSHAQGAGGPPASRVGAWRATEQTRNEDAETGLWSLPKRLKMTWDILRGARSEVPVVNTTVMSVTDEGVKEFQVTVAERPVDAAVQAAVKGQEPSNHPGHGTCDHMWDKTVALFPTRRRGRATTAPDGGTGVTVDTSLNAPLTGRSSIERAKERLRREELQVVQNQEAVPAVRTAAELGTSSGGHERKVSFMDRVSHMRRPSLPNLNEFAGDLLRDRRAAHAPRPSWVQHRIHIDEEERVESAPALDPPVQTSGSLVHDYGLGRLHIQVQLQYDPTTEFWSHLMHFEKAPPQTREPFAVAVMVHHWMRLYNVVAPPITAIGVKIKEILTWQDAVASMLTLLIMTVSLRWPFVFPLLLHVAFLRYMLITRLRRDLLLKSDAIHQSLQDPHPAPMVTSAATILGPAATADSDPFVVAGLLPHALAQAEESKVVETTTTVETVTTTSTPLAHSIPGMEPLAAELKNDIVFGKEPGHANLSAHTRQLLNQVTGGSFECGQVDSDTQNVAANTCVSTAETSTRILGTSGWLSRLAPTPNLLYAVLSQHQRTEVHRLWVQITLALRVQVKAFLAWLYPHLESMRNFLRIFTSANDRILSKDVDAWEKAQTGFGIFLSFVLPVMKDVRSTNRSFEPRRLTKREARHSLGARLGLLPSASDAPEAVTGLTSQGQLTSMSDTVSTISVRAKPADRGTVVRPLTTFLTSQLADAKDATDADSDADGIEAFALGQLNAGGGGAFLAPCADSEYAHVITTVPLIAEESPLLASDADTKPPSLAQLKVAKGVAPLKVKVPRNAELVCLNPNTVLHDPAVLASAAEAAAERERAEAELQDLPPLLDPATKSANPRGRSRNPLALPLHVAYFVPPPAPPRPPAPGSELGAEENARWKRTSIAARASRYALLLMAVADFLTPDKSQEAMAKFQHTCGDVAQVLEVLPKLFDWSNPSVTKAVVIITMISALSMLMVPMRMIAYSIGVSIVCSRTTPMRYLNDTVQGLFSYIFGSLGRAERAAATHNLWASSKTTRASVLARYDVVADVVENRVLYARR